jgi:hypothetical protein
MLKDRFGPVSLFIVFVLGKRRDIKKESSLKQYEKINNIMSDYLQYRI